MSSSMIRLSCGAAAVVGLSGILAAQPPASTRVLTTADYARAERFMGYNTNPLVLHSGVRPTWLPDDRFWYRVATENGNEFVLVDPAKDGRTKLAEAPASSNVPFPPNSVLSPDRKRAAFIRD